MVLTAQVRRSGGLVILSSMRAYAHFAQMRDMFPELGSIRKLWGSATTRNYVLCTRTLYRLIQLTRPLVCFGRTERSSNLKVCIQWFFVVLYSQKYFHLYNTSGYAGSRR